MKGLNGTRELSRETTESAIPPCDVRRVWTAARVPPLQQMKQSGAPPSTPTATSARHSRLGFLLPPGASAEAAVKGIQIGWLRKVPAHPSPRTHQDLHVRGAHSGPLHVEILAVSGVRGDLCDASLSHSDFAVWTRERPAGLDTAISLF